MRSILIGLILLTCGGSLRSQSDSTGTKRRDVMVKFDLGGLFLVEYFLFDDNSLRLSAEAEWAFDRANRFSATLDMEIYGFHEHYPIYLGTYWDDLYGDQIHWGLHLGGRYYVAQFRGPRVDGVFIEPQFCLDYDIENYAEGSNSPEKTIQAWSPDLRLRAGIQWSFWKRWGLQLSAEAYRKHYLYSDRQALEVLPELNVVFKF